MHIMVSGTLSSLLLCIGVASARPCTKPAESTAFDVAGLKTKLMVTAITCNQQDRYNLFVQRFRRDLLAQELTLHGYFVRAFGGRARHEHDDYVTSLANTLSESGIQQGTLFCQQNIGIFTEVLSLAKDADLPSYATRKALPQPFEVAGCPVATRTARTESGRR